MRHLLVAIPLAAVLLLAVAKDASARRHCRRQRCCNECQSCCQPTCASGCTTCTTPAGSGTADGNAADMTPPEPPDEATTPPPKIKPAKPKPVTPKPRAPNATKSPSDVHEVPAPAPKKAPKPKRKPKKAPATPKATTPAAVTPPAKASAPAKATTPAPSGATVPPLPPPPPKSAPPANSTEKSAQDHSTAAPAVDVVHWTSLFDGKSLGDWKISDFGTNGKIEVKDGNLVIGFDDGCSGVTWKGAFPKTDFEISLEAKRVDGSDFFCGLTFPVGNDPCSFIVGGWGGSVIGLSSINGDDASENSTGGSMKFDNGRWYTIRVRVNKARIVCWIDNEQKVDESLAGKKISIRTEVEASKPLGIATWHTTGAIRNIRWRPLTKAEQE